MKKVFLGVTTFRKSESIQLHCIAKLAKSYSFLAFLEDGTSFALCDVCDVGRVILAGLSVIGSHRKSSIWLMALRFISKTYGLLPLTAALFGP